LSAQWVAAQPDPDGTLSAAASDQLESQLDAFFAEPAPASRKTIYDAQLSSAPVGLTLDELNTIATAAPPAAKSGLGGVYKLVAPGREDHPRGFFNIALPDGYTPTKAWPLAVVLHGRGGTADSLAGVVPQLTAAGWFVILPTTAEPSHYWSTTSEVANVYRLLEWTVRRYRIDLRRLVVTGASMGALPELWAGGAPLIGDPGIVDGPSISRLRGMPLYILQGAEDKVASVEAARKIVAELTRRQIKHTYIEMPGVGHAIPPDEWRKVNTWITQTPPKPWSPRPLLLPAEGERSLSDATADPLGLQDADDAVLTLTRDGKQREALLEVKDQLRTRRGNARLYVLRAVAALPPLLEPTPASLDPAQLTDAPGGWGHGGEQAAMSSLKLALNTKVGKGAAERRFDAEVNHLIARIWAKRFAVAAAANQRAWVTNYNAFARHAGRTQELQPGHQGTNRLIQAVNASIPKEALK